MWREEPPRSSDDPDAPHTVNGRLHLPWSTGPATGTQVARNCELGSGRTKTLPACTTAIIKPQGAGMIRIWSDGRRVLQIHVDQRWWVDTLLATVVSETAGWFLCGIRDHEEESTTSRCKVGSDGFMCVTDSVVDGAELVLARTPRLPRFRPHYWPH